MIWRVSFSLISTMRPLLHLPDISMAFTFRRTDSDPKAQSRCRWLTLAFPAASVRSFYSREQRRRLDSQKFGRAIGSKGLDRKSPGSGADRDHHLPAPGSESAPDRLVSMRRNEIIGIKHWIAINFV